MNVDLNVIATIHFEDHGQDFLEWDINKDYIVVCCRPAQGFIWCLTTEVMNYQQLTIGGSVEISRKNGKGIFSINYPVANIVKARQWNGTA